MATRGGKRAGAGRKKGTPNKASAKTRDELWAYIDKKGTNPFEFLVDVVADDKQEYNLRVQCAKEVLPYLSPKLKQTEVELGEKTRKAIRFIYGGK